MDASLASNKAVLEGEKIDGYPSLLLYRNGVNIGTYGGPRTARYVLFVRTVVMCTLLSDMFGCGCLGIT